MRLAYVILGAAIGAPARFVIDQYLRKFANAPWGTFAVNVAGSFVIGLTWGATQNTVALVAIGFAGAFTTWSTFMLDIYLAIELKKYRSAAVNYIGSLLVGLLAAAIAMNLVA
ncbi:CrcB protein [Candidatus Planktophila limnetica]|uniref:Fluoride-specific ion channel FluC n=1 Tax=Candidatus Planktophila limnetica TaxID=573600 RepID=A0A249LDC0_9ACTN|nr:CrcB family protein [Candidatus Planktophila limnetica]ASY27111.1 CrcB protein [Candidatus Planktophila limnetica]